MIITCHHCGTQKDKPAGAVNRAINSGGHLYCGRICAGLARREWKPDATKKEEKRIYDAERRQKLADEIRVAKASYHKRTYDPAKAAQERKGRMPKHLEYCRRPEYKSYKRDYDRKYRAQKDYGEFAECALLVQGIDAEVNIRMSDYDVRVANDTINKRLKRRREYDKAHGKQS